MATGSGEVRRSTWWLLVALCLLMPILSGVVFELWLSPIPRAFVGMYSIAFAPLPALRIVALAAFMIAGVLSSLLAERVASWPSNRPLRIRTIARQATKSRRAWVAAFVSPIVFYGLYAASRHQPDTVEALLLAYQNGFFWETVLSRAGAATTPPAQHILPPSD